MLFYYLSYKNIISTCNNVKILYVIIMFFFSLFSPLIFYKSIFFYYNLCYRFDKFIQLTKIIFLYFLIDFFILFFNIKLIKNHSDYF
jgi:hypothetical protein